MRKRYSAEDLAYIETQAKNGTGCKEIGETLGVSPSAIKHVLSRREITFCRKPVVPIPGEIWKECPNIPDIQVSDQGRLMRTSSQSIIDGYVTSGGYLTADISGVGTFSAHRLIAQTFLPNPENKPEVNHKDGCKTHNAVNNLEWVTPTENMQHAVRTGLKQPLRGQEHPRTALTEEEIVSCSAMKDGGKTYREIADVYGVGSRTVSRHVNNYRRNAERPEAIP